MRADITLAYLKYTSKAPHEVPCLKALPIPHYWPTSQTCTWKYIMQYITLDEIGRRLELRTNLENELATAAK